MYFINQEYENAWYMLPWLAFILQGTVLDKIKQFQNSKNIDNNFKVSFSNV